MKSDEQIQLDAQRILQEFDDARAKPDSDLVGLGKKAIDALDTFIAYWQNSPHMRHQSIDLSEEGHTDLRLYAERQIEWATAEKERVLDLLPKSDNG